MILAGDIGGTNTRLAWCEIEGERIATRRIEVYPSRRYDSLHDIVQSFVDAHPEKVENACFGVAGPVRGGKARISNLPWEVDSEKLAELLELDDVILANDLEATAYGIASLEPDDFAILNEGTPDPSGNEALIAAGTGLGEAGLHWEGDYHRPFATEGGHADFAPRTELESELLFFLKREYGRVSYERVLSGPGLFNIYRFLRDSGRADEPPWLGRAIHEVDPSPVIATHGLAGETEICVRALDLFVSIYGAEAGNLALKLLATAGLYVGGGIAPKILPKLLQGRFFEAFVAKGRMAEMLSKVPLRVIKNDHCALLGAARRAHLAS
jgi:glucokinase